MFVPAWSFGRGFEVIDGNVASSYRRPAEKPLTFQRTMKNIIFTIILSSLFAVSSGAAELGDPAKPLDIKEWVKGNAVDLAAGKGKTIYVVEFWATWCGPCRSSIPHLTELQKQFKDKGVVFVGVSDEKSDVVKKFVEKMGDKMDYVVAIDAGKTSEGYMEAYGANGIPHAFVVDKEGRIAWEGHPMNGLDKVLDQIIDGKYDLTEAKAKAGKRVEAEKRQTEVQGKLQRLAKLIMAGEDNEETKKLEAELTALDKELGGILGGENFEPADFRKRVQFSQKVRSYQQALMEGADAEKLAALEKELEAGAPKEFDLKEFKDAMAQQKEMQKVSGILEKYMEAVGENGDAAKAAELAKQVEALDIKNAELLNQIAWAILAEDTVKNRDLKLALALAKRAVDASEGKEGAILDTYARALFDNGKIADAIEQQKKAIELADDEDMKAELRKTLQKYESKGSAKPQAK